MTSVKKRSPKKGTVDSARKFTLLEKSNPKREDVKPEGNSNSITQDDNIDEDSQYADDFESQDSPENNLLYFVGKSIDDLLQPLDEFSDRVQETGGENGDTDDPIYDELFDNDSLPTSPIQYKEKPQSTENVDSDEEDHHNLNQMSSVTFGEEDSDSAFEKTKSRGQNRGSSPHRASSQQTVKRVFTAPKHRMIITPARSVTSSDAPSGHSNNIYDTSKRLKSNNNDGISRFPRPPKSSERSSKSNNSGVKFKRIHVSAVAAPALSPKQPLKNTPSVPTVGEASKLSSQYTGSKATLPTKGSSTVVTAKWGASDQGSIFHAHQRWHESELQRQLQVANKRVEEYRRLNEILHDKIDSSHVQETIDQLKCEIASKNAKIKELQKENQDLKFLSRYQQKELVDQDFGLREEYDSKMSQEKYIEVLSVHISKLRAKIQEYKSSEEKHIADWEESQSIIKKLRGKVTKLKKTIQKQKEEIKELRPANEENKSAAQDDSSIQNASHHIGHNEDNFSVGNNSYSNVSALHEEGSLASHLADYVSSKVEKRYLAKIQVLKKDLERLRLEASESSIARKKIENEIDRRELLVKRQNTEIKELKTKFEELSLHYKQLLHGCELFMGDSAKREAKQPAKPVTPKPLTPVVESAPLQIVAIVEPLSKVVAKSAILAGDDDELYSENLGTDANTENNEDDQSIELPSPSDNSDSPSRFFLTEEQFSTNSIIS